MSQILGLLFLVCSVSVAYANPAQEYAQGTEFAKSLLSQSASPTSAPEDIFGGKEAQARAENLGRGLMEGEDSLADRAHQVVVKDEENIGHYLIETEKTRARFDDVQTSEFFKRSEKIINNPSDTLEVVKNKYEDCVKVPVDTTEVVGKKIQFCEITRKPEKYTCKAKLIAIPNKPKLVTVKVGYTVTNSNNLFPVVAINLRTGKITNSVAPGSMVDVPLGEQASQVAETPVLLSHQYWSFSGAHRNWTGGSKKGYVIAQHPSKKNDFTVLVRLGTGFNSMMKYGVELKFEVPILPDFKWLQNNCPTLEQFKKLGFCTLDHIDKENINETRQLPGLSQPIKQPHWAETRTYRCGMAIKEENKCDKLREQGCEAIGSECILKKNTKCYKWKQTYECLIKKDTKKPKYKLVCGDNTFCLEGDCVKELKEENDEILEAVSQLEVLKEALGDSFKPAGGTIGNIFGGEAKGCKIHSIGRNCCDMKGWLKKQCDDESKVVNEKRKEGLCHEVGTYYVEKSILKDKRKKTNYCCFKSKLARVIHEQGRSQIGVGWGVPEEPMCRGLSPDEIAQIDFSRMDFSFLYQDIAKRQKKTDTSQLKKTIQSKMNQIRHGLKPIGDRGTDE